MSGAPVIGMFIVGRIFSGFAGGMLVTNVPIYVSEIAPAHSRGLLTGITAATVTFGTIVSSALGLAFTFFDGSMQWRAIWIVLTGLSFCLLASLLLIPESPRWLVEKRRYDEAWNLLKEIHRLPMDPDSVSC